MEISKLQKMEVIILRVSEIFNGCRFSDCDYFCFGIGADDFECGCPDNMIYDSTLNKCICNIENLECLGCFKII